MTEVDVLLELERKLNAHAAEQRDATSMPRRARPTSRMPRRNRTRWRNRCAHTRLHAPPRVPLPPPPTSPCAPPRAPTRPCAPLRAPTRPHLRPRSP